jgi:hypothetical protein
MLELKPGPGSVPIAAPPHTEHAYATNGLRNTVAATPNARTPHRLITDPHASKNMRIGACNSLQGSAEVHEREENGPEAHHEIPIHPAECEADMSLRREPVTPCPCQHDQ